MKAKIEVINKLGKFSSDFQETNEEEIEKLKRLLEKISTMEYFSFEFKVGTTIYFPMAVIRESVVLLHVEE